MRNALKIDLKRSMLAPSFMLSVCIIFLWLVLNSLEDITGERNSSWFRVEYILNLATTGFDRFTNLLLVIAATAYAWSYCQDKDSGFMEQVVGRVGLRTYAVSKVAATALSAFFASVIAMGLFTGFLYIWLGQEMPMDHLGNIAYLNTAGAGKTGLYYFYRFTVTGISCSLGAVFGLMVTAFIPNVYMAFLTPLMAFYVYEIFVSIFHIMPRWLSLDVLMFAQVWEDDVSSFLAAVVELPVLIALCGWIFCRRLRKERTE